MKTYSTKKYKAKKFIIERFVPVIKTESFWLNERLWLQLEQFGVMVVLSLEDEVEIIIRGHRIKVEVLASRAA